MPLEVIVGVSRSRSLVPGRVRAVKRGMGRKARAENCGAFTGQNKARPSPTGLGNTLRARRP